jgi:arylsulfatase A-like enzyme
MKQFRVAIVLVVLVNIVVLAWLLLRSPADMVARPLDEVLAPLVADNTMAAHRYDLSDRGRELNLILISMDALRMDRTGIGGHDGGLTPNLDRFGDEAVVFHNAVSAAPWTLPSHMSVWTGRWPTVHGITNKLKLLSSDQMVETSLSPGISTFPDVLIREGWTAGGFTGGAGVQASYGFGRSFDQYLDDRYFGGMDHSAPPALEWARGQLGSPFFLFLHGYDTHGQYPLPEADLASLAYRGELDGGVEEQARLREAGLASIDNPGDPARLTPALSTEDVRFLGDVYDRKIRNADQRLGSFLAELKAMGLYDNSIIAIISDHGDEILDHGALDHGFTLYEEQLHVVMAIRFPGYARRHDVDTVVRTVDLFPTLFDAIGLAGPPGVNGESLLPVLRGEETEDRQAFAESDYRLFVHHRMLRQGDHKLILDLQDGKRELYNLAEDPHEQRDISSEQPRQTYEMEQDLRRWMETMGTNPQDYLGMQQTPISIF